MLIDLLYFFSGAIRINPKKRKWQPKVILLVSDLHNSKWLQTCSSSDIKEVVSNNGFENASAIEGLIKSLTRTIESNRLSIKRYDANHDVGLVDSTRSAMIPTVDLTSKKATKKSSVGGKRILKRTPVIHYYYVLLCIIISIIIITLLVLSL